MPKIYYREFDSSVLVEIEPHVYVNAGWLKEHSPGALARVPDGKIAQLLTAGNAAKEAAKAAA